MAIPHVKLELLIPPLAITQFEVTEALAPFRDIINSLVLILSDSAFENKSKN